MVAGRRASGGQSRAKELERIWNVPHGNGNKDLHFSRFCLPIWIVSWYFEVGKEFTLFAKGKESRASQVRKTLIDLLALTKPWLASTVFNLVLFRDGDFETLDSISCSSLWAPPPLLSTFPFLWYKLSPWNHVLYLGVCLSHCQVKGEARVLGVEEPLCSQYSPSAFLPWSCCLCPSWQCSSSDDSSSFRPVAPPCPNGFSQLPVKAKSAVGSDKVLAMLAYLLALFNMVSLLVYPPWNISQELPLGNDQWRRKWFLLRAVSRSNWPDT